MKQLVVFYSRTGTTKKVAEAITYFLKCDVEEILDLKDRSGVLGWLSSGMDATLKKITEIEKAKKFPESYDVTIIGTPIWNNTMSAPVRTYISEYRDHFKSVAFFCTQYGFENNAFKEMEALCGKRPVATLRLRRRQVKTGEYVNEVKQFCERINVLSSYYPR
jgi:flavodoxin